MAREATDICLRVLKESNKSRFDSFSRYEQCIDHIPYYLSGLSRTHFLRQPFSKQLCILIHCWTEHRLLCTSNPLVQLCHVFFLNICVPFPFQNKENWKCLLASTSVSALCLDYRHYIYARCCPGQVGRWNLIVAFVKTLLEFFCKLHIFIKSRAHSRPRPTSKIIAMIALRRAILMKLDPVVSNTAAKRLRMRQVEHFRWHFSHTFQSDQSLPRALGFILCAACGSVVLLHAARVFDYFVVIEIAFIDNQAQITETISPLDSEKVSW